MEAQIHLISIILVLSAACVPAYLCLKLKNDVRILAGFLTLFLLIHAGYHIAGFLDQEFLEDGILEPLSVSLLIVFGLLFLRVRNKRKVIET